MFAWWASSNIPQEENGFSKNLNQYPYKMSAELQDLSKFPIPIKYVTEWNIPFNRSTEVVKVWVFDWTVLRLSQVQ